MWPVQTLTLLLCLTDDEQLFAQAIPQDPQPVGLEAPVPVNQQADGALLLRLSDEA